MNLPVKMNMLHKKRSNWISLPRSWSGSSYLCWIQRINNYVIKGKDLLTLKPYKPFNRTLYLRFHCNSFQVVWPAPSFFLSPEIMLHLRPDSKRYMFLLKAEVWMGEGFGGEWIHVYVWLGPFTVHLKLS